MKPGVANDRGARASHGAVNGTRPVPPLLIVLALWAGGLCAAAQFAKIGLVLPELGEVYPEADVALGFLVSSVSVVGVLFGLMAGLLAARIGLRPLLLGGLALGAAVSLVQALLPPLPLLLASRVLEGVSHLAIVVAAPTLIAATSTASLRSSAMTLWGTFFGVSFALTAWLGLPLVESRGPGALFLVHGMTTAAVAVLLAVVLPKGVGRETPAAAEARDAPRVAAREADEGRPPPFSPRVWSRRHVQAWRSPFVAAPAAGWLFYTITFVALLAVLPGLAPPAERAFAATAMPLASIAASMTIGVFLTRRLGAVRVVGIGFGAALLLAAALPLSPGEPLLGIALFAALGLVQGASFAAVPELNAEAADQALANGALAQAGNLGNACGTPLVLALLGAGGFGAMVVLVVGCYAAGIVLHRWLAARRESAAREQRSS